MTVDQRERPSAVPGERALRFDGRNRRNWVSLIVALLVMSALVVAFEVSRGGGRAPAGSRPTTGPRREMGTLALSVLGAGRPLLAVLVGGLSPAVMPIPGGLTMEAPGLGHTTTAAVADLPGDAMRVAVSNTLGMWVDHYAVTGLHRLGGAVDRNGELPVDLPEAATVAGRVLGPGRVLLDGASLAAYLAAPGAGAQRWEVVLSSLMASPSALQPGDFMETDDPLAVRQVLAGARGADIVSFPTRIVGGAVRVPDDARLDPLVGETFGTSGAVARVLVVNASGAPAVAEVVATRLIPQGFRVVLSQNASRFNRRKTEIVAMSPEQVDAARRAQRALGTGRVGVSQVPSGVEDITIIVGRDLSS